MLESLSGHPPPPSLARVIYNDTEGNPFFVEEVFQHLAEEGKLFDDEGNWRKDLVVRSLEVPQGVRLVIGRRLQRLGDVARAVLTTGAIIGRVFSLRVLEAVERSGDADDVLDAIEEAERAHLLVAESSARTRYRFAHELIRQTLIKRCRCRVVSGSTPVSLRHWNGCTAHRSRSMRRRLRVAYRQVRPLTPEKTARYLMLAAAQARAAAGFEEALAHLDNALSLWEGERNAAVAAVLVERGGVLLSLARAAEGMDALQQAADLYDELGDVPSMIIASLRLAGTLVWHARHRDVRPVTSRALARLGPAPHPAMRCRLLIYDALADIGSGEHPQRALDTMAKVTPLQQSIDDPVYRAGMRRDGFARALRSVVYRLKPPRWRGAPDGSRALRIIYGAPSTSSGWRRQRSCISGDCLKARKHSRTSWPTPSGPAIFLSCGCVARSSLRAVSDR